MRHIVRVIVAICLLGTVAGFAADRVASINMTKIDFGDAVVDIQAAGLNGRLTGRGKMQVGRAVTYPIVVTDGSFTIGLLTGSTRTTVRIITLNGFIKPRVGAPVPFVLLMRTTGRGTMTITTPNGVNPLIGFGKVTLKD